MLPAIVLFVTVCVPSWRLMPPPPTLALLPERVLFVTVNTFPWKVLLIPPP